MTFTTYVCVELNDRQPSIGARIVKGSVAVVVDLEISDLFIIKSKFGRTKKQ